MRVVTPLVAATLIGLGSIGDAAAEDTEQIVIDGQSFASWAEYYQSPYFQESGKRCGTPSDVAGARSSGAQLDCGGGSTDPYGDQQYAPEGTVFEITVVVHIITEIDENPSDGIPPDGTMSDLLVQSQIDVLNQDFMALPGTPGEDGTATFIQFRLATVDPNGSPTTGITRSANNAWFGDSGDYTDALAWDPTRYCNIYTLNPNGSGILGYVPFLPQWGPVGSDDDGIRILWSAFGSPAQGDPPYNLGRTVTHEMGHYLGLYHTFQGGCGTPEEPGCFSTGDVLCDTNAEAANHFGCTPAVGCGGIPAPIENYLNYTDDLCMTEFTNQQARRMRCTLIHYREDLYDETTPVRKVGWGALKSLGRR